MEKFRENKLSKSITKAIFRIIEKANVLSNDNSHRYECIECGNIFDKAQECQCGSIRFLLNSKKYEIKESEIVCGCGKGKLKSRCHYDCDDGFIEEFICSRCFNMISIYEYMEYEDYLPIDSIDKMKIVKVK